MINDFCMYGVKKGFSQHSRVKSNKVIISMSSQKPYFYNLEKSKYHTKTTQKTIQKFLWFFYQENWKDERTKKGNKWIGTSCRLVDENKTKNLANLFLIR